MKTLFFGMRPTYTYPDGSKEMSLDSLVVDIHKSTTPDEIKDQFPDVIHWVPALGIQLEKNKAILGTYAVGFRLGKTFRRVFDLLPLRWRIALINRKLTKHDLVLTGTK